MGAEAAIRFTVNGREKSVETDPDRTLLEFLREDLGLLGTKYGCGEGQCGACSVLVDGRRMNACRTAVSKVSGRSVVTIEGLAKGEALHPVQQAFLEVGAYQCGFCTAGMIVAAVALLDANPAPSDVEIVAGMDRNLCRCCSYPKIVRAVRRAVELTGGGAR
ncbi:(2Fe-2S)-binding protein [Paludisphaera mucosa]|uniref:(2Fe-2S)-binding protein n=1 Tax=Paludisphaera mucosa TaxID=3030827 RepID=A0ABT6FJN7_9BACT|nr:(2Fe-2S)-binding protein [Paludisphaera mucosa]MDG3007803.1 (2Fe-2S)-binding protein [Paludisphaera mucosa]